ncbi:Pentatricopeptide repeat-containing protein [Abeliophyllum distichum]|uniref:Pentatricopeptide repeat-containing protein n=1 Tax=Abeliophyllum distichum TaxID=126358 RepID=A0ABD1SEV8_9LAMI
MRGDGYQSDFVNYSLIIQSLTRNNTVDAGILEKLYNEMEADMIELDGQLLNDIIVGFAKAGDINRALYFLGAIQGNGLSPKTSTLVTVVNELGNMGRTEEAEAVFEELKEGGLKPRTRAYNALLRGYVKVGALKDAEYVVSEMEETGGFAR